MTNREKQLLFLFIVILAIFGGYLGYERWSLTKSAMNAEKTKIQSRIKRANASIESKKGYGPELDWLEQYRPAPSNQQNSDSDLQAIVSNSATSYNLTIEKQEILKMNTENSGVYQASRIRLRVTGKEQNLFQWLDEMQAPEDFRAVKRLLIQPKKDDDTLISALVRVEHWFVEEEVTNTLKVGKRIGYLLEFLKCQMEITL